MVNVFYSGLKIDQLSVDLIIQFPINSDILHFLFRRWI